jgi:putative ABC transport system permease protein
MLPVVKERIERDLAAPYGIIAFSNNDLRRQVFTIFDQTFAITYALEAIAIIVAVIGIINALLMMIVEREREIGILKAVGASNWQVQKMVIVNGGLIGTCAAVIGSVTGLLLSLILVFVINRQSFGWSIQYHPNIATIASVSAVLIVTAMLSALWPAYVASRRLVKTSLRYE